MESTILELPEIAISPEETPEIKKAPVELPDLVIDPIKKIDLESLESLEEFPVESDFGVKCWQGSDFLDLVVPKGIFKKIEIGDNFLGLNWGARQDKNSFIIRFPIKASSEETIKEAKGRIQKVISHIEDSYADSVRKSN